MCSLSNRQIAQHHHEKECSNLAMHSMCVSTTLSKAAMCSINDITKNVCNRIVVFWTYNDILHCQITIHIVMQCMSLLGSSTMNHTLLLGLFIGWKNA